MSSHNCFEVDDGVLYKDLLVVLHPLELIIVKIVIRMQVEVLSRPMIYLTL